jgi:prepilin signal peptidase PulO-like enzyme (type II secretory pathway)
MRYSQALRWYHNVPVVSWVLLRTVRVCDDRSSARYPAVELLTGVVFALHAFVFEPAPLLLVRLAFAAVLIVLAFIDIDRILPDSVTLTGIPLGVLASFWLPPGWRTRSSASPSAAAACSSSRGLLSLAQGRGHGPGRREDAGDDQRRAGWRA